MSKRKKEVDLLEGGAITEEAMEAYIGGTLSTEERTQFEKLLADDPFAQDALEGMQATPNRAEAQTRIAGIKKKIRSQTGGRETKTMNIHWVNYVWAAVVLGMLVGVGFLMVTYLNKNGTNEGSIAQNKTAEQEIVLEQKPEATITAPGTIATEAEPQVKGTFSVADSIAVSSGTANVSQQPVANVSASPNAGIASDYKTVKADTTVVVANGFNMNAWSNTSNVGLANNIPPSGVNRKGYGSTSTSSGALGEAALVKDEASKTKRAEQLRADKEDDALAANAKPAAEKKVAEVKDTKAASGGKSNVPTQAEAMQSFNAGRYKESAEQFDAILKSQPNNADAQYFGGVSEYLNGNLSKSEKQFDKLLKSGDRYLEGSKWYKANILIKKGKTTEAKKILNELSNTNNPYKERATNKLKEL